MSSSPKYLTTSSEWTFELLISFDKIISDLAHNKYKLDTFPNQIEIINAEQMLDAYSSAGMPLGYNHWSFGKQFLDSQKYYKRGHMGLAYEIVINSNPCIAYLLEENSMALQVLIIAHACYGHNSFFKSNYLFKTWTSPESIIDYFLFAKNYIAKCEEKYGIDAVEELLDSCHALMNLGVDRYKRPTQISINEEVKRQTEREKYLQLQVNDLWRTIPIKEAVSTDLTEKKRFPEEPQENLLYFFEKHAPLLEPWQREIIRIIRKTGQYFYPQRQTKVMNEGWATFWHYTLINDLYELGYINEGFTLEALKSHTDVIYQPCFDAQNFSGINPYTLGFNMFMDIKRICTHPTDEDKQWFPELVNTDWLIILDQAMRNYKDESFIRQFLSPNLIREMKLFSILDNEKNSELEVTAIHDEHGYKYIREALAEQFTLSNIDPNIEVYNIDRQGSRSLTLRHTQFKEHPLDEQTDEMLKHVHRIWGFDVILESFCPAKQEITKTYKCSKTNS
ncbi:MAG: SpoVR family protein [Gammaproteobacteria bacterium]|nr:SpoVR family protein [Gammaproteobacteria bacterium]